MLKSKKAFIIIAASSLLFCADTSKGAESDLAKTKPADIRFPRIPIHAPKGYIPIVDITAYGTYSHADKGSDVWGASVYGSVAPAIKYDDKLYLIPLYDGSFERQKFFIQEEEGARTYNEIQHHDLSFTAKYLLTERATISPVIFGGWDLNIETSDEHWGKGLYDYREFGSGGDFDYLVYDTPKGQVKLTNGAKWYIRHYPNYNSLISLASTTAPEVHEKDYNGVELYTGWQYQNLKNMSLDLKYILLMKFFTDKRTIDDDGVLEDKKRQEYRNSVKIGAAYSPTPKKGFQYSYSSELICNTSNQNFYDSRGTTALTDDVFTPRYYNYLGFDVRPDVSYIFTVKDNPVAILGAGYSFLARYYMDRRAEWADGTYKPDRETDFEHIFKTSLEIPLNKCTSWITRCDYTIETSNMDYEQYYTYSYKMLRVMTGISISY